MTDVFDGEKTGVRWIASNTLGSALGIETMELLGGAFRGWIASDAIIGAAQRMALPRPLQRTSAWISGTGAAWTVGIRAGLAHGWFVPDPYWAGFAGGTLETAQSYVLWRQVSRPALWAPAMVVSSILGWVAGAYTGFWVYDIYAGEAAPYLSGGAVGGAVIGAVSAPALLLVLRKPKHRQEISKEE
ncbi:MAG: hypothetical protein ACLQU1_29140 [Bryobacteraceae bacterium]